MLTLDLMPAVSPTLVIRFPSGTTAPLRDRLVALLADFDLVAVHEDDLELPQGWTAHFESAASRDAAAAAVAGESEFALIDVESAEVEDEDWARRTQADLPAIRIGRLIVAPPWDLPKGPASLEDPAITVVIEPSRGFGTGHHQSTRLCLALLQERRVTGLTAIDAGTGSGVLAIAAAKLGAAFVAAFDSDPDAVENARENIAINDVAKIVEAHVDDLTSTTLLPADLVLANLTGTLLARHAADLGPLVRPSGSLIVSGFNVEETDRVSEGLRRQFDITERAEEDDWHAYVLTRRPAG